MSIGAWAGLEKPEALNLYKELYELGTLSSVHFAVELTPFARNAEIARKQIELYTPESLNSLLSGGQPRKVKQTIPFFNPSYKMPFLAQSVDMSLFEAQSDSVNVGHYQLNFITGNAASEISIQFIETRNGAILNSAQAIKDVMFKRDGTQALPKDYLMKMTIYVYDRHSAVVKTFTLSHLVALQTANLPLDATTNNNGIVTLSFIKMFPMLNHMQSI